ncbi:MAG: DUF4864 domain-containing protein [Phycisphaerales bacterium]
MIRLTPAPMVSFANKPPRPPHDLPPVPEGFPTPGPEFSPDQVVQFQLYALQHNEQPCPNSGIAAAFEFASPANRQAVGPLARFIELVHNDFYLPMLNFATVDFGKTIIAGDEAQQPVIITTRQGRRVGYVFLLSRQKDGPVEGCWMTDGVIVP